MKVKNESHAASKSKASVLEIESLSKTVLCEQGDHTNGLTYDFSVF